MKKWTLLLAITTFLGGNCLSQMYVEPMIGYQVAIGSKENFKELNSGIALSLKAGRSYELILRVQKSWSNSYHSADSSFTPSPSLPLYTPAYKTIKPDVWYFSIDERFIVNPKNKKQLFSILLHTGFSFQQLTVNYQYDKNNYVVLNPEHSRKAFGFFIGTGIEYMRLVKNNRVFFQLTIDSAPAPKTQTYVSGSSFIAPLALNIGYSFLIQKKKHEK